MHQRVVLWHTGQTAMGSHLEVFWVVRVHVCVCVWRRKKAREGERERIWANLLHETTALQPQDVKHFNFCYKHVYTHRHTDTKTEEQPRYHKSALTLWTCFDNHKAVFKKHLIQVAPSCLLQIIKENKGLQMIHQTSEISQKCETLWTLQRRRFGM